MTAQTTQSTRAFAAAALLDRWADAVPSWDSQAGERWDAFADRRFEADKALEERLRGLPTCILRIESAGADVTLTLAGVRVRSRVCLAQACRDWATEIRRRAAQHGDGA